MTLVDFHYTFTVYQTKTDPGCPFYSGTYISEVPNLLGDDIQAQSTLQSSARWEIQ